MPKVHLLNPMRTPVGGSENRTVALFELLAEVTDVQIWAEEEPHPEFSGKVPIRRVGPPASFPKGGNLVFVGTYFSIGGWLKAANANRAILIHNLPAPIRLREVYQALTQILSIPPEVVYASEGIAAMTPDIPGVLHESPIDLEHFSPQLSEDRPFTVGRFSRDVPEKHNPEDTAVYQALIEQGIQVRLMGADSLNLGSFELERIAEGSIPPKEFLHSLDVFFYRTRPDWREAYGRVIMEALACGIPVVAESRHGFSEKLTHGENVLFANSNEEIISAISRLRDEPAFRQHLATQGRKLVEEIYGEKFRNQMQSFYSG